MTEAPAPTHGQERDHHWHTEHTMWAAYQETRSEKFCAHCQTWVPVHGVLGYLTWTVKHRDGDCVRN
jgi:hypothetical protein